MKLSRLGEFGLIERIRRSTPTSRNVRLGIGDDAAWVRAKTKSFLVTTDLLLEGVHFNLSWTSLSDLGYKTLAVNLSDIAAMGGIPAYLTLSLGIPRHLGSTGLDSFYAGIRSLAMKHNVAVIGGDTSLAQKLIISACVIGHTPFRPISRSGAKLGNDIYVSGTLGDSALALQLLRSNSPTPKGAAYLLNRHHKPTPRLAVGAVLARRRLATAMIDVSDGLLQDLGHICRASLIGARIWEETLPLSGAYRAVLGKNETRYALAGGEDYELLFSARRRNRELINQLQHQLKVPLTRIGACVPADQGIACLDRSGKPISLLMSGHDHFKKQRFDRMAKFDSSATESHSRN
jgi:thiamine-monophosphate kinase